MKTTWRIAVVVVAIGVSMVLWAPAASAHGGPGANDPPASNYRTRITAVSRQFPGVTWRIIEAGNRIELINTGPVDVTVIDYDGKPYLRVGPDGVFENRNSAATYLNVDSTGRAPVPAEAFTADAEALWRKVSSEQSARWHDHRAHWMGGTDPPQVQADPTSEHVIIAGFEIPAKVGGSDVTVAGDVTWIPAPPVWPWLLVGFGVAATTSALAWTRRSRAAVMLIVAVAGATSVVDAFGGWDATAEPGWVKIAEFAAPALAWFVLILALVSLRRADRRFEAAGFAAAAATGLAFIVGVTALDWLTASQVPSGLPPVVARLIVSGSIGTGLGALAAFGVAWRDHKAATSAAEVSDGEPLAPDPATATSTSTISDSVIATHRRRLLVAGAIVLVGGAVVATLANERGAQPSPTVDAAGPATAAVRPGRGVVAAVCDAASAARRGDGTAARIVFEQRAHTDLHTLAAEFTAIDRAGTARLLEAKQRVEATIGSDVATLAVSLDALIAPTRLAAVATGWPAPDPCPETPR